MHRESTDGRSGPLRNGNPRGNPNLAPRCEARARTTGLACRAPAMKNGRCRMHGGKATGPRTAEGLERMRAAKTKHGFYSAESKAARCRVDAVLAETCALLALVRAGVHAVDGVAPQEPLPVGAGGKRGVKVRRGG